MQLNLILNILRYILCAVLLIRGTRHGASSAGHSCVIEQTARAIEMELQRTSLFLCTQIPKAKQCAKQDQLHKKSCLFQFDRRFLTLQVYIFSSITFLYLITPFFHAPASPDNNISSSQSNFTPYAPLHTHVIIKPSCRVTAAHRKFPI